MSSLAANAEWLAEMERRVRRAVGDPSRGQPWDAVDAALVACFSSG